jgi:hypothetical protein
MPLNGTFGPGETDFPAARPEFGPICTLAALERLMLHCTTGG